MSINIFNHQQPAQQPANNNEVITVNNVMSAEEYISKEQANSDYVKKNATRIRQKGFIDAGHAGGDPIALECGLQEVKNDYLSWCHQHRGLFTANMREAVNNVKQLLQQRQSELTSKEGERDSILRQLADSETELTRLNKRHYRVVEILKLMLAIVGVVLGVLWVSYVYANFFFDLSCTPKELRANGMFSEWGFMQGIKFAAVPLMLALFIGLASNRFKYVKALLAIAFVVMDVAFSWNVEMRITQIQQAMGIDQAFDTAHFIMVVCMAFLPAVCLTSTLGWAKDMFYLDGIADAKGATEKVLATIDHLKRSKSEAETQIAQLKADMKDNTDALFHMEGNNEQLTVWYSGRMIAQLCNLYYMGFLKFINSIDPGEETAAQNLKAECQQIYKTFLEAA